MFVIRMLTRDLSAVANFIYFVTALLLSVTDRAEHNNTLWWIAESRQFIDLKAAYNRLSRKLSPGKNTVAQIAAVSLARA